MEHDFTRRRLLRGIAATAALSPAVLGVNRATAALPRLPDLSPGDALLLRDGDAHFEDYQPAFNARLILRPQLRALCRTAKSVGAMVDWCRNNDLPFALRSGGHCFEGLSQSSSVVIDTRMLDQVAINAATKIATVGAGASLGSIYLKAGAQGLALPAGSCPTVGVSGHVLGGGYGHLARPLGLACDSLLSIDLIDPQGRQIHADSQENSDLFWACRGGGGGSFGAATGFRFQLHAIPTVFVFHVAWRRLAPDRAVAIMADWQAWAPRAPNSINATLVVMRDPRGGLRLQCSGQSIGSAQQLRRELKVLSPSPTILSMSHLSAVKLLAGSSGFRYTSGPIKGKSDFVVSPLSHDAISTLMHEINAKKAVPIICDPYGGAIATPAADATAFRHRAAALYSIEYISEWTDPKDTAQRLRDMDDVYAAMRPHVSGAAYVNYCDVDLVDWQSAYWGLNLPRLKQIKAAFDPANVFRHAQSVPVT